MTTTTAGPTRRRLTRLDNGFLMGRNTHQPTIGLQQSVVGEQMPGAAANLELVEEQVVSPDG